MINLTSYQAKYFANYLTLKHSSNDLNKFTASLQDAQVDLTPHQIDAALFAFKSPLSNGAILADEVGLGKTIEAGIVISQHWAELNRTILIIAPSNLRKQWVNELKEKFFLPSIILEKKTFTNELDKGNLNPFNQKDKIIICSYEFARSKAVYLKNTAWNLIVIDEAHRLRNVYKKQNVTANTIKRALDGKRKILLTATPLQNSILELYGMVSIIDDYIFGDLKSFKSQFSHQTDECSYQQLSNRIQPICKRTLRKQVLEYTKYTNRIAICEEYYPGKKEQLLYDSVSEYLQEPVLFALPNSQRQLISLILRKLLSSSSYAISHTLGNIASRLEDRLVQDELLKNKFLSNNNESIFSDDELNEWVDLEGWNETKDESESEEIQKKSPLTSFEIEGIRAEIKKLHSYRDLALSIKKNSKADHLIIALDKAFHKLAELGSPAKALIFTESRRTQDYLFSFLSKKGYQGKIVLFNGSNNDIRSKKIYSKWLKKHEGSSKISGSPTADKRAAIVDYFKEEGSIMIATEAASEGINLQFCSLIVNYDLPWNPQRIEQRIGRCHRYGQKFDVVVVNFLNKNNAADRRVYELLSEKFKLFDGVFGASDEVLGSIGNGVDFEKRIAKIYNECRTPEEIESAFAKIQQDLQEVISNKMSKSRNTLMENFDETVQEKLRADLNKSLNNLNKFEKYLWMLSKYELASFASFNSEHYSFILNKVSNLENVHPGAFYMPKSSIKHKNSDSVLPNNANLYRIGHPLAKQVIDLGLNEVTDNRELIFNYGDSSRKIAILEKYQGQTGYMKISRFSITSFEKEEHLIIAGITDEGYEISSEILEQLFSLDSHEGHQFSIKDSIRNNLNSLIETNKEAILSNSVDQNNEYFEEKMDKVDTWATDMRISLEKSINDLEAEINLKSSQSRKIPSLKEKLAAKREIAVLEKRLFEKRSKFYEAADEIKQKKDSILDEVEKSLEQNTQITELFTIKWILN